MFSDIDTRELQAVEREVLSIYISLFPAGNSQFVHRAFGWAEECFGGRYDNYQQIDVLYHDLEHTLQGTLCLTRLIAGYKTAGEQPELSQRTFELALLAILFHDTGYLKAVGDNKGTGAKYTLTHVSRSAEFAGRFLREKGFSEGEIRSIQNMIRCTGVNADLATIPFGGELERRMGFALATADLLGQMAASDYIDKLGILYQEFEESAQFNGGRNSPFSSYEDLRGKTPAFWAKYVLPKINRDFLGLHRFLSTPPSEENYYTRRIAANIHRLEQELNLATAA
jgi:hypothetical protein